MSGSVHRAYPSILLRAPKEVGFEKFCETVVIVCEWICRRFVLSSWQLAMDILKIFLSIFSRRLCSHMFMRETSGRLHILRFCVHGPEASRRGE